MLQSASGFAYNVPDVLIGGRAVCLRSSMHFAKVIEAVEATNTLEILSRFARTLTGMH